MNTRAVLPVEVGHSYHLLPGDVVRFPQGEDVPLGDFIATARQSGCAVIRENDLEDDDIVCTVAMGSSYHCYGLDPVILTPDIPIHIIRH